MATFIEHLHHAAVSQAIIQSASYTMHTIMQKQVKSINSKHKNAAKRDLRDFDHSGRAVVARLDGLSIPEIAELMEISHTTLQSLYRTARKTIKRPVSDRSVDGSALLKTDTVCVVNGHTTVISIITPRQP